MRGMVVLVVLSAGAPVAACSLGALDGFSGGDAGAPAANEASVPTDGDSGAVDAGNDDAGPCGPNGRIAPTRAFDLTAPPVAENGPVCNIENLLVEDGKVAGLDRTANADSSFAGENVSSCIGVELAGVAQEVVVRLQPTSQACTVPCSTSCGTGHSVKLFAGQTETTFTFLREIQLGTSSLADYTVEIAPTVEGGARFLAICRAAWGPARDDIAVDAVYGRCR